MIFHTFCALAFAFGVAISTPISPVDRQGDKKEAKVTASCSNDPGINSMYGDATMFVPPQACVVYLILPFNKGLCMDTFPVVVSLIEVPVELKFMPRYEPGRICMLSYGGLSSEQKPQSGVPLPVHISNTMHRLQVCGFGFCQFSFTLD